MGDPGHVDADRVRHIAHLARLALSEGEAEARIDDLESILTMVDRMRALPTEGVEPLSHPLDAGQRLRPDVVTEADRREAFQAAAPQVQDGLFVVPRVIE
ncbi:MAG: Asp-tRNA(Asn)/Glu-tRNA(Gln) amidotransferase subunit GatC [Pseudomonadales bacterium]|jgi:aspartyl-tRNA(Asn)/glutamyl-tRNA(Gln) amidotransferase subunit C|nr:Asp-tRNA(Asn)/Glu-tRNA(Gln) amidotransferase subunit GatC [Pseudomonadales bacterium]